METIGLSIDGVVNPRGGVETLLLAIEGERLIEGDTTKNRFGLVPGYKVDDRFLKIVVFLAIRRCMDAGAGWVMAEELFVGDPRPGSSPAAVRALLQDRLASYPSRATRVDELGLPVGHLIQYRPLKRGEDRVLGAGMGVGPYRLGFHPSQIRLDRQVAWSYLNGQPTLAHVDAPLGDMTDLVQQCRALDHQGSFLEATWRLQSGLIGWLPSMNAKPRHGHRHLSWSVDLSLLWNQLGMAHMQMGVSDLALAAAKRAHVLAEIARHPESRARALLTRALALAQQGRKDVAQIVLDAMRAEIEKMRPKDRKTMLYAESLGMSGYYASQANTRRTRPRESLESAVRIARDLESPSWIATWEIRLASHCVQEGNLQEARRLLDRAAEGIAGFSVAQTALFTCVMAEHALAREDWIDARRWLLEALRIGVEYKMAYQIQRIQAGFRKAWDESIWPFPEIG